MLEDRNKNIPTFYTDRIEAAEYKRNDLGQGSLILIREHYPIASVVGILNRMGVASVIFVGYEEDDVFSLYPNAQKF